MDNEAIKRLEEKKQRSIERTKKIELRLKQINASEKKKDRKQRARDLIEIGAIITGKGDRTKLLEYLKNNSLDVLQIQKFIFSKMG